MIKKILFLAFICAFVSCQKDAGQPDNLMTDSSHKLAGLEELPSEVRAIIVNGGLGHFECQSSASKKGFLSGGNALGDYAYPYNPNMGNIRLYDSSLPCQPNIPYFVFGNLDNSGKAGNDATFRLVLNPSYFDAIKVVDVDWDINGQNDPNMVQELTMNSLSLGELNSITCTVYSTHNNLSVYAQEMTFDFELARDITAGTIIDFKAGYTYTCSRGGGYPIVAP